MGEYEEIEDYLIGKGYSERDARFVTFKEYIAKRKYDNESNTRLWEIARWEIYNHILLSPDIKQGHKPRRPQDLLRLPSDEQIKKIVKPVKVGDLEITALKNIGFIQ